MHAFSRSSKGSSLSLTRHVLRQMQRRAIPATALDAVLDYGRVVYTRGAAIHAIGRNEIARWAVAGIDLAAYEGIQVVCTRDGTVLTTYRNRNFRRLRGGLGRGRYNHRVRKQNASA